LSKVCSCSPGSLEVEEAETVELGPRLVRLVTVTVTAVAVAVAVDVRLVPLVAGVNVADVAVAVAVVDVVPVPARSCERVDVDVTDITCVPRVVVEVTVEVLETSQTSISCSPLLGKLIPT